MKIKITIKIIGFMMLFFKVGNAFAQKETIQKKIKKNEFGLLIGYNQGYLKDLNFSSLNYKIGGPLYKLNYKRENPKSRHAITAGVSFSTSKLKTDASSFFKTSSTSGNIYFSFLRKVKQPVNSKFKHYVGVQYQSEVQYINWKNQDAFSFFATHGFAIKGMTHFQINKKHQIQTSLSIPVLGILARPPYNGIDENILKNENNILQLIYSGKIVSLNNYYALNWQTNFKKSISEKFDLNIGYTFYYQKISDLNEFIQLQNQLAAGLHFKF